jgi:hypothetical protein
MEFLHFSQGKTDLDKLIPGRLVFDHLRFSPMFHLLNVKYILLPSSVKLNPEYFPRQLSTDRLQVYLNRDYLPRCYIVHKAVLVRDKDLILAVLNSPDFDPRRMVILENKSAPLPLAGSAVHADRARVTAYSSNRVVASATLTAGGYLILADTFYPGWKAFVDGREAEIYRANYVQRAVYLDPGEHTVEFVYSPLSFKIGAGISIAALGVLILLILRVRRD